jgi:thiol-disulfide isomerase/thioredoxin
LALFFKQHKELASNQKMRKYIFLVTLFIHLQHDTSAQAIPTALLHTLDGKNFDAAGLNVMDNKPKLVFFWATWCVPCINELTTVNDIKDVWAKELKFEIFAIAEDDNRSFNKVAPMVNGRDWQFTVLTDKNQELKRKLGIADIPHTLIVKNGKIIYRHIGYSDGDEEQIYSVLKANQ